MLGGLQMPRTSPRIHVAGAFALVLALLGTPIANAATVTVAAAGDIARISPATPQRQTASLISRMGASKVLVLGDAQYEHGEYANFLRSYDPTWGTFNKVAAPVPGNHEYETPRADGYFRYFAGVLNAYGATATEPTKGYYSFNIGDWHVVALNSNCTASGVSCSAQNSWLKADLEADSHRCELVFYHHPSQRGFATTAASKGVELILAGHTHTYERWDRKFGLDLRQLVVGTGGKSLSTPASGADAGVKAYGVAKLTLNTSSYSWQFVDVAGRVRDSGSDTCGS
jgi:acid phosphatase type 7